jgi:hypothetical protein
LIAVGASRQLPWVRMVPLRMHGYIKGVGRWFLLPAETPSELI